MIVAEMLTDQTPNCAKCWLLLAAAEHGLGMTAEPKGCSGEGSPMIGPNGALA
jgi:hypothetical protein